MGNSCEIYLIRKSYYFIKYSVWFPTCFIFFYIFLYL
nr:MAG TPA: hypothetical protein [Caudoviricetes sp.]DAZ03751.1 MAG TPA: hypothetical protein [Caudoviricetes sp.]